MIKRLDISAAHSGTDEQLRKYLRRKIGHLDRYIPRHARGSAHAEIRLKEAKAANGNGSTCEVTLHLPKESINVSETTVNMYAAIDIVELKLKQRIKKYKDLHGSGALRRRLTARLRRRPAQPDMVEL